MIPLPLVNLSGLVTGNTGVVLLNNLGMSANPSLTRKPATLRMHNDSGTGLLISFKLTSGAFYLPAGGWADVQVAANESEIDYQVTYVLQGAPVTTLQITYYAPNEQVPPMTQLGNSPIGVSGLVNVSTASAIDNEGNVAATQWLKVIQSGGPASNFAATVDGSFQINQWDGTTQKNLFQTIANAGAGNPSIKFLVAGLIAEILGTLLVDNAQALQWKRTDGVASSILQLNNFDQTQIFGASTGAGDGDVLQILKHDGTIMAIFDLVNGLLNIKGTKQTVNGNPSGTMDVYEIFSGVLKIVMLVQTNYQQSGAAQFVTLKTAFTNTCGVLNFGAGPVNVATGGVAASGREVTWGTGTAAGSQAATSQANQDAAWFPVGGTGFTQVGSAGGYASAFNGIVFYLGL